jgi:hypothetical protein
LAASEETTYSIRFKDCVCSKSQNDQPHTDEQVTLKILYICNCEDLHGHQSTDDAKKECGNTGQQSEDQGDERVIPRGRLFLLVVH